MTATAAQTQDLLLRNGATVTVRPVTPEDEAAIFEFLTDLCEGSRRLRFFSGRADLRSEARRGAAGDDAEHHGLVALAPGRGVVGHAIYVRVPAAERAEVAVEVADDLHHLGLATLLMIRLAQFAEEHQIPRFFAEVLPENREMLAVFRDGFAAASTAGRGEVEVEFATSSWRDACARFQP
jgi:GNAT superfamily N-acetyltransferase